MVAVKTGLTVAALIATGYSRVLGRKVSANQNVPIDSGTEPSPGLTTDAVVGESGVASQPWLRLTASRTVKPVGLRAVVTSSQRRRVIHSPAPCSGRRRGSGGV